MSNLPSQAKNSARSSQERTEHRTWIKGRAATLLGHYWREDDDPALLAAIGKDWADVLEGLPQEYIQRACIQYQRDEPRRKPTPGAIYQIARALMPRLVVVSPPQVALPTPPQMTDEQLAERRARAEEIMARAGFRRMNAGGDDA